MFRVIRAVLYVPLCLLFAAPASAADTYPDRPIRMIVPFAPGGGVDITGRLVAEPLGQSLGETVVVDNRPGASSIIGTEIASKASPDGYTLLMSAITMAINVAVYKELPFDVRRDFAPISLVSDQPGILVAHPALPAKTFKEFVALARSQPGKLTFGSAGAATGTRLATELVLLKVGAELLHVAYKGTGPALTALLANETSILMSTLASAIPHVKSGRLRAYGVTSARRADPLPEVPTIAESGVPGYEYATWYGLLAPAATPRRVLEKLRKATVGALDSPKLKRTFADQGMNPMPTGPAHFSKYLDSEIRKWTWVVREAKIAQQ